jgi:membrane protease YdiL (CAAX protease family)
MSRVRRTLARHPIAAFLVIGNVVYFATVLTPWVADRKVTAFELPLHGIVGGLLGVGLGAFVVTAAADGRAGVADLVARTLRWRVPVRWYLIALLGVPLATTVLAAAIYQGDAFESPADGWLHVIGAVCALFVLQLVFFQLTEEIGWTGFFQDRLRDRYGPIKLSAVVAVPWAFWHLPDFFAEEGWGLEQLVIAVVFFLVEVVLLFFARVIIVWLYERTGRSVLLVVIFHASVDATISRLTEDLIPGSNAVRFVIVTAVTVVAAAAVLVSWWRRSVRHPAAA